MVSEWRERQQVSSELERLIQENELLKRKNLQLMEENAQLKLQIHAATDSVVTADSIQVLVLRSVNY